MRLLLELGAVREERAEEVDGLAVRPVERRDGLRAGHPLAGEVHGRDRRDGRLSQRAGTAG